MARTSDDRMNKKLPGVLYVYVGGTGDDEFFVASTDSHEQAEGVVGIYRLDEKLYVRHKPQFRREKTKAWFDK